MTSMMELIEIRSKEFGSSTNINFFWPIGDEGGWQGPWKDWLESHSKKYFTHVKNFDTVITVGANCGIHAYFYAQLFKRVYAFEPSPLNFCCLNMNCPFENVWKFQMAIGDRNSFVGFHHDDKGNVGTHSIASDANHQPVDGPFPLMTLDSFNFTGCDLLQLDIEGAEYSALLGAEQLINKFQPVIIAERNVTREKTAQLMGERHHYVEVDQSCADSIWLPYDRFTAMS